MSVNKQQSSSASDVNDKQDYIKLKLINENDIEIYLLCKFNTKMIKVMKTFAKETKDNVNSLRFLFRGRYILEDDTPKTLKLKDDDIIDVFYEQCG
uniref:Ubiquitin-like domain-containing protein n=1 Tax=Panagrolaimus davidi TaxID=227884 RepID=A0A914R0Z2_9BILA